MLMAPYGEDHPSAKLTEEDVLEIRERYAEERGTTRVDLAEEYDIHPRSVYDVTRGISWAHVGGPIAGVDYDPLDQRTVGQSKGSDHSEYVPPEQILDDLIAGYLFLGCWPKEPDYRAFGEYASRTIQKRFGSYTEAVEAAKQRYEETEAEWTEAIAEDPDHES